VAPIYRKEKNGRKEKNRLPSSSLEECVDNGASKKGKKGEQRSWTLPELTRRIQVDGKPEGGKK